MRPSTREARDPLSELRHRLPSHLERQFPRPLRLGHADGDTGAGRADQRGDGAGRDRSPHPPMARRRGGRRRRRVPCRGSGRSRRRARPLRSRPTRCSPRRLPAEPFDQRRRPGAVRRLEIAESQRQRSPIVCSGSIWPVSVCGSRLLPPVTIDRRSSACPPFRRRGMSRPGDGVRGGRSDAGHRSGVVRPPAACRSTCNGRCRRHGAG